MKIGRNNPCPCGSGEKYKKCCYLKNNTFDNEIANLTFEEDDDDNTLSMSEDFNDDMFLLQAINNLRKYTLGKKDHINEYYKIRKLHSEVINTMVRYHESGKFQLKIDNVSNNENDFANVDTINFIQTNFDLETREGAQALYDLLIYKASYNMNCITEEFIKSNRYRKPEKIEFLHSMLDSRISLFEITRTHFEEGYVYLKDIYTGIEYKIVDVALSGSQTFNNIYLYTRLIKYHDIVFSTGLNLIFSKEDKFVRDHIQTHKNNYTSEGEFLRFTQLYNYYSKNPDKMKVIANSIK